MSSFNQCSRFFTTTDKVTLHYIDKGNGQPLILLPSWGFSCQIFTHQLNTLSKKYRLLALDMRGHGHSEKVNYGYKIHRLAKDLQEFIHHLNLNYSVLLGHTLGASVILSYLELFGEKRLDKIILMDRAATPILNPTWTKTQISQFGPTSDASTVMKLYQQINQQGGDPYQDILLNYMISSNLSKRDQKYINQYRGGVPRQGAAMLFYDNYHQDWRSHLPYIQLSTLIIAGRGSPIPVSSQIWLSQQIKNAHLQIFEVNEGGKHFPYIENPKKFNRIIEQFIDQI